MIELDERDIRGIALNRFHRKNEKKFAVVLVVLLGFFIGFLLLEGKFEGFPDLLALVPLGGILICLILYTKRVKKFVRRFLEEWKETS